MTATMGGPSWLTISLGILMLAAAAYAAGRIVVARAAKRVTDFEVDAHHVLMGVSMAGMLIPELSIAHSGSSATAWLIIWVVVTAWFAVSVVRGSLRAGPNRRFSGHHLPHLVMSGAMVYMFAVFASTPGRPTQVPQMAGMGGGPAALVPWPTLDVLFLVFMAVYAVMVLDRFPLLATAHPAAEVSEAPRVAPTIFLAPRAAGVENVLMAVVMCFMLGTMLA